MQTTIANYMLPAMQVVCHLIVSGNPGTNITTSGPVVMTPLQQPQNCSECGCGATTPAPENVALPYGYEAHPDIGVAYRVYDEDVTWIAARKRCIEEGAQLALIDSDKKIEYLLSHRKSRNYAHIGYVRMYDDDRAWVGVSNGLPLANWFDLPCYADGCQLDENGACAELKFSLKKLVQGTCNDNIANFVCEVPLPEEHDVPAN